MSEVPDPNGPVFTGYQLWYNSQGLIWLAWALQWRLVQSGQNAGQVDAGSVQGISAMEYRYDSARGRYRVQARDPRRNLPNGNLNPNFLYPWSRSQQTWSASEGVWSDYDGIRSTGITLSTWPGQSIAIRRYRPDDSIRPSPRKCDREYRSFSCASAQPTHFAFGRMRRIVRCKREYRWTYHTHPPTPCAQAGLRPSSRHAHSDQPGHRHCACLR